MKFLFCTAALLFGTVMACNDDRSAASNSGLTPDTVIANTSRSRADSSLVQTALELVGFLRGESALDSRSLADTVELRVAPEGGGAVRRVGRDALRDRAAWTVTGSRGNVSLIPPTGFSTTTTRVGRHFNCREQDLATRAPDLVSRPHVGVRMQPGGEPSCLQSWNATFVFDTSGGDPRLTAVVYDQWEW